MPNFSGAFRPNPKGRGSFDPRYLHVIHPVVGSGVTTVDTLVSAWTVFGDAVADGTLVTGSAGIEGFSAYPDSNPSHPQEGQSYYFTFDLVVTVGILYIESGDRDYYTYSESGSINTGLSTFTDIGGIGIRVFADLGFVGTINNFTIHTL
jgi:hypothetical protein